MPGRFRQFGGCADHTLFNETLGELDLSRPIESKCASYPLAPHLRQRAIDGGCRRLSARLPAQRLNDRKYCAAYIKGRVDGTAINVRKRKRRKPAAINLIWRYRRVSL
jgi:hypothetical protein